MFEPITRGPDLLSASPMRAASEGIGDVNSTARGTGARYNGGKPDLSLIPLRFIADSFDSPSASHAAKRARSVLYAVGEFQETGDKRRLSDAFVILSDYWPDCARVFDYGRRKYAAWNWAKGMAWSVPIACIGRHALAILRGETRDPESGERHEGHILCNVVMLALYADTYQEGNDLPAPELFYVTGSSADYGTPPPDVIAVEAPKRTVQRSVVVYGSKGCGKTTNASALAAHFGLETIVDDWSGQPFPKIDTLVLSNDHVAVDRLTNVSRYTFEAAMREMSEMRAEGE